MFTRAMGKGGTQNKANFYRTKMDNTDWKTSRPDRRVMYQDKDMKEPEEVNVGHGMIS